MLTLLSRLLAAFLWLPLAVSKPFLRAERARRRRAGAWRIRPPEPEAQPVPAKPKGLSYEVVAEMRVELRRVLDADESHRRTYRHLARFERKFAESGLRAIETVPISDLRRALRDFEALVRNWSSRSLADLRSRMAVTLADRASAASVWIAANSVSSAFRPPPGSAA